MVKNPDLTVVGSSITAASSTPKFGRRGADLWRTILDQYDIEDAGGREVLTQVCAAVDRLDDVTAQIQREGLTVRTKNGSKEHPLLKTELGLRSFVTRNLQRLGINIEPVGNVGRPTLPRGQASEKLTMEQRNYVDVYIFAENGPTPIPILGSVGDRANRARNVFGLRFQSTFYLMVAPA